MQCSSCNSNPYTCGATIRSRRCSMINRSSHPNAPVPFGRNRAYNYVPALEPESIPRDYAQSMDWSGKDYIDPPGFEISDVYGSALGQQYKDMMMQFDDSLAISSYRIAQGYAKPNQSPQPFSNITKNPINHNRYGYPTPNWNVLVPRGN